MQERDDNNAIVRELIEEGVGKAAKKNTAKCTMHEGKGQRVLLGQ